MDLWERLINGRLPRVRAQVSLHEIVRSKTNLRFADPSLHGPRVVQRCLNCVAWWNLFEVQHLHLQTLWQSSRPSSHGTYNGFALVILTPTPRRFRSSSTASPPPSANTPVVMMLDRASWHGSGDLRVPHNITLEPLPVYSPELNPVARVALPQECFHSHRIHADYEAIVGAACRRVEPIEKRGGTHQVALLLPVDPKGQSLRAAVSEVP